MDKYEQYDKQANPYVSVEQRGDGCITGYDPNDHILHNRDQGCGCALCQPSKWLDVQSSNRQVGGSHYSSMAVQPSHFIRANKLGWHEGNAIKYICRHTRKGGRQDIEKAIHYLELILEEDYGKGA